MLNCRCTQLQMHRCTQLGGGAAVAGAVVVEGDGAAGLRAACRAHSLPRCCSPLGALLPTDPKVENKKADAKREGEVVRSEQRGREVCQRRLNRAELESRQLAGELPGLHAAVASLAAALVGERKAAEREAAEAARLQGEVAGMVQQVAGEKKLVRSCLLQTFGKGCTEPVCCVRLMLTGCRS